MAFDPSVARNLQTKETQLRDLRAGVWDLNQSGEQPPEASTTEFISGLDDRGPVLPAELSNGGKYRCE